MYTVFVKGSLYYIICLFCLVSLFYYYHYYYYYLFCLFLLFSVLDLSFGTLSLIIHLLVHYDASVYAPM